MTNDKVESVSSIVYRACDEMVTRVLEDEHYIDKWTDDEIDEACMYTRMLILEILVDSKYKAKEVLDSKGEFDAVDKEQLENYAMDGIDLVRSFDRGY